MDCHRQASRRVSVLKQIPPSCQGHPTRFSAQSVFVGFTGIDIRGIILMWTGSQKPPKENRNARRFMLWPLLEW